MEIHQALVLEMPTDRGVLELDHYRITFDRSMIVGLRLEQPIPNLIYIRERPDAGKIAVMGIYNYNVSNVNIQYVHENVRMEFGIAEVLRLDGRSYNQKLGSNLWYVYNLDVNDVSEVEFWFLRLDDNFMCQVMVGFLRGEDPRRTQIKNLIESFDVEYLNGG